MIVFALSGNAVPAIDAPQGRRSQPALFFLVQFAMLRPEG
jgi:hypothetical protein